MINDPVQPSGELAPYVSPVEQQVYNTEAVKGLMKQDLNIFGSIAAPSLVTLSFPDFYCYLWLQLLNSLHAVRDFSKFAIGLPRGHGKTFFIKLLLVYTVLFTQKKYILVVAANATKAEAIIADVFKMLRDANIVKLFGSFDQTITKNTQDIKMFTFNGRDITIEAAGQGTAIRGSNRNNVRPDVILCDDVQTRDGAKSLGESREFHTWFTADLMKAKAGDGCTYIYIGNMYKDLEIEAGTGVYTCMLRNLQRDPNWLSMIVGAILADGTALWEELQPLTQLLAEYASDELLGQGDVFCSEVLNDPKGIPATSFDPTKLKTFDYMPGLIHQGNFICIDPSTSKATPDQTVLGYYEMYDNVPVARELLVGKFTGPEQAHLAIDMALRNQCTLIVPEAVAYQHTLGEWIRWVADQRQIYGLTVQPANHRGQSKNSTILRFFQSCMKGEFQVTAQTRALFVSQALAFDPKITNNIDDIIDCGAMAVNVGLTMRHLMHIQHFPQGEQQQVLEHYTAGTSSF